MSKMSTDLVRHALNGQTMGTRWTALFYMPPGFDATPIPVTLQNVVDQVDQQMSTWKQDSDLMQLNRLPVGGVMQVPQQLRDVLALGLSIGHASHGAFDIGMGDAVVAWGFGPCQAKAEDIRKAMKVDRFHAYEALEIDGLSVRKRHPLVLDLNGIAKGYAVDCLAEALMGLGIGAGLVGIDGEMRAIGSRPDGSGWSVAIESPDPAVRTAHSVVVLQDAAVATSGDYRHQVEVGGRILSHTMDPKLGAPLRSSPASVTLVAQTCAQADAWATAFMVLGVDEGIQVAQREGLSALYLLRQPSGEVTSVGCGPLFRDVHESR